MRILFVNQFYRPDVAATGQLLADLAEKLAQDNQEIHVLCSRKSYLGGDNNYQKHQVIENVHIHRIGGSRFGRGNIFGKLTNFLSFYFFAAWKLVFMPRFDICVFLTTPPFIGLIGIILHKIKGTKIVHWTMDLYPEALTAFGVLKPGGIICRFLTYLAKRSYRCASQIISLGDYMTQRLIKAGVDPDKIATVHNWSPCETSRPDCQNHTKHHTENAPVTLMYSGNLGSGHELNTVLIALKRLKNNKKIRFLVNIGDGKSKRMLREKAMALELKCLDFRDPVPVDQLSKTLAMGQIHIVSQLPETKGIMVPSKLYGIMAAARAIIFIGPENSETAQILRKSNAGIIIAPRNADAMTEAIRKLLENPNLVTEMCTNAHDYYEKHLGKDRSLKRIMTAMINADVKEKSTLLAPKLTQAPHLVQRSV